MCGFAGFVHLEPRPLSVDKLQQTVRKMSGAIVHRGPDAEGIFVDCGPARNRVPPPGVS